MFGTGAAARAVGAAGGLLRAERAAQAAESAGAADLAADIRTAAQATKGGITGKVAQLIANSKASPEALSAATKALNYGTRAAGVGIQVSQIPQVIKGQQKGETAADALERRLNAAGWTMLAAGHEAESLNSDALNKPISELPENLREDVTRFKAYSKNVITNAIDTMKGVGGLSGDFKKTVQAGANMLGKKAGPEFQKKVENVEDDLKAIWNENRDTIKDPETAAQAIRHHLEGNVEAPMQRQLAEEHDSEVGVVPNFRERLSERLDKFFDDNRQKYGNASEVEAIKQRIMDRLTATTDHGNGLKTERDPNIFEAENARQGLNKSSRDVFEHGTSSGYRAASAETANFLREMIDEGYDQRGITGVKEARAKEADLISIADAFEDAQFKFKNAGVLDKVAAMFKGKTLGGALASLAVHYLGGGPILGGIAAGAGALSAIREMNQMDIGKNIERSLELARRAPQAQATTPGEGPEMQGPQPPPSTPPQGAAPVTPPRPQPPAPVERPAVNHDIHGELASYFDEDKDDVPYSELMQRYANRKQLIKNMIEEAKANGQELSDGAKAQIQRFKDVQRFVNKMHAADDKWVDTQNQKQQEKYKKDVAKWEADRAKEAATQKDDVAAAAAAKEKQTQEQQAAILADERVAHGPVMKALDPVRPIENASGKTSDEAHGHENGHIMAHAYVDHEPFQMVSNLHPDAIEAGAAASVHTDVTNSVDTGMDGIERRVIGVLGGPAWDEVHSGLPMSRNTGARSDIAQARKILREDGGLQGDDLNKVFDELYDHAKKAVSHPEALAIVNANKGLREVGLHENYHISPGRMAEYVKKLKAAYNGAYDGKTPTTPGVREGATDRGVQEGKPAGPGDRGGKQAGPAEEVPAEEARKGAGEAAERGPKRVAPAVKESVEREIPVPKKRTTGSEKLDRAIEEGGGIPGGIQKGFEYVDKEGKAQKFPDTAYVHEPTTGTSLNFPLEQITPEFVRQRLEEKRAEYAAARAPKTEASNVDATPEMKREVAKSKWSGNEYYRSLETTAKLGDTNLMYQTRPEDGGFGRIIMSQVDPEMRGQGIGKEIYRSLFQDAKQRGLKGMKSDTSVSKEAQHVWDSLKREGLPIMKRDVVPGGGNGGRQVEYTLDFGQPRAMEASHVASDEEKGLISTRQPSGKKATENPLEGDILHIGREAIDRVPGMADKVAAKIKKYAGVAVPKDIRGDSARVIDHFTNYLKDNLKDMYQRVDPAKAEQTRKWYESANKFARDLGEKYDLAHQQVAGVIAAMSPQKDWDQNVSLAERVVDTYKNHQDKVTSPEMMDRGRELAKQRNAKGKLTNPSMKAILPKLEGKTLAQIENPVDKAAWVRLHDETSNPRNYAKIDPGTGNKMGDVLTDEGEPKSVAWGSLKEIAKALSVLHDGSRENISNSMGDAHKVRNFYNNILDPSNSQAVTIDTHAVAAAHHQPFSGKSTEVKNNFGGIGSKLTGAKGMYGIYADAYRAAASELGVLPRELQSVVWEEVREMFPDEFKRAAGGKHVQAIQRLWRGYDKGNMTLPETREAVSDYAQREYAALKSRKPGAAGPQE